MSLILPNNSNSMITIQIIQTKKLLMIMIIIMIVQLTAVTLLEALVVEELGQPAGDRVLATEKRQTDHDKNRYRDQTIGLF